MPKKYLIAIIAGITGITLTGFIVSVSGVGKSLLDTVNKMRPVYKECRIEGRNFNSVQPADCQNFDRKVENGEIPDGEYTIHAKYLNKSLSDNIIPVKIENGRTVCPFVENGYIPSINALYGQSDIGPATINGDSEIPIGSDGIVLQINYYKNGQLFFYDTNVCKSALRIDLLDADGFPLGEARLDKDSFVSSRSQPNEIMISGKPSYEKNGEIITNFKAGNVFAKVNFAPELTFKLVIPCSAQKTAIIMPHLETDKNILIPFKGLNAEYLTNCGSKLYLSLQNTNRVDDIQIIENLKLEPQNNSPITTYKLDLNQIDRITDPDTVFPISFKLNLELRDRSDSSQAFPLSESILTITGYTPGNQEVLDLTVLRDRIITDQQASAELSIQTTEETAPITESIATSSRPKVRKSPSSNQ